MLQGHTVKVPSPGENTADLGWMAQDGQPFRALILGTLKPLGGDSSLFIGLLGLVDLIPNCPDRYLESVDPSQYSSLPFWIFN